MSTSTASKPRSLDPIIGATLCDRYRVERIIGRGGMGLVYLAEQLDAARMVVIKLLAPQWLDDGTAVTRFAREGSRLQQLAHPNVVQLFEHGHHGDQAFIAMEYLDGEPLRRFLARNGRVTLQQFTPIAAQILAAVGYAHDRGIMLRDIKPANIMLCERDGKANVVKLLDFGLAKLVDGDDEEVTKSHVIGTAGYLAPEQIKGEPVDLRVDVYAIGVLFYLMLAGASPIVGENDGALLYNHVHGTPKPLGEHLPDGHNVPELLIALVHQCLEKDPQRRPADANEIAEALFECVPPKLLGLPDADDASRSDLKAYRDARDGGLEPEAGPLQSSSEWTKPVVRAAIELSPAEASAAGLPQPVRRPTPAVRPSPPPPPVRRASRPDLDGVPEPIADRSGSRASGPDATRVGLPSAPAGVVAPRRLRPTPVPRPVRSGEAPPRGRAKAIGDAARSGGEAATRADDVRSESRTADLPQPRARTRETDAPRAAVARATSAEAVRPITAPESRGSSDAVPELDAAMLITDPGLGAVMGERASGPLAIGTSLPVPRRLLFAVGALAVLVGAMAAWVMFMPSGEPTSAGVLASASAIAPSQPTAADSGAGTPTDRAPAEIAAPVSTTTTRGIVDVRAPSGARIEIDGVDVGAAPMRVELGTGSHRFRVVAPGYAAWSETVEVGSGDNPVLEARLKPSKRKAGSAKLEPDDADATVDPFVAEAADAAGPSADDEPVEAAPLPDKELPQTPPPAPIAKRVPPPVPEPKGDPTPFLPTVEPTPTSDPLLPTE